MNHNLVFVPPFDSLVRSARPMVTAVGFAVRVEGDAEKLTRLAGELGLPDYQGWVEAFGQEIVLAGLEKYDFDTLPFSRLAVEG